MCQINPNCRKKETKIYNSDKVVIYVCKCGCEWRKEKIDNVNLTKKEQIKIEKAFEKYYEQNTEITE